MGNEQTPQPGESQVLLTELQAYNQDELMFQSKLSSSANYDTRLLKKTISFNSSSDSITSYMQKLNFFGQYIECDNLLLPVYCYVRQTKGICSDAKQLEIYQEIYSINIKDEIMARKKHYQKFTQNEVWYLLFSIINAARKFEPYKISSGCLKTSDVVLNQRGHLKIRNQLTEPEVRNSALPNYFCKLIEMQLRNSSRIYDKIGTANHIPTFARPSPSPSQYFKFVRLLTGNPSMICIGIKRAQEMMEKLKYSKLLVNLLRIMLSGHQDRPLPSQIYLTFKPYEKQILNLQGFKFDTNKIYESLQNSKVSMGSIQYG